MFKNFHFILYILLVRKQPRKLPLRNPKKTFKNNINIYRREIIDFEDVKRIEIDKDLLSNGFLC